MDMSNQVFPMKSIVSKMEMHFAFKSVRLIVFNKANRKVIDSFGKATFNGRPVQLTHLNPLNMECHAVPLNKSNHQDI